VLVSDLSVCVYSEISFVSTMGRSELM